MLQIGDQRVFLGDGGLARDVSQNRVRIALLQIGRRPGIDAACAARSASALSI